MDDGPHPRDEILQVSPHQCKLLAPDHSLTIHVTARIVSLLAKSQQVLAQWRFPLYAFRVLMLLLLAEEGASYEMLYAGLYCPPPLFRKVLEVWSLKVPAFQEELARHRAVLRAKEPGALEAELQQIRRAIKGRAGLAQVLEREGFGWCVQTIYKKGYVLRPAQKPGESLESEERASSFDVL